MSNSTSNPYNKPVSIQTFWGGVGINIATMDQMDHIEYTIDLNPDEVVRICEQVIVKGAVERAELEQKIAKLEARLDALERNT